MVSPMVFKIGTMENITFQENKFGREVKKGSFFEVRTMNTTITMLRMFRTKNDPIPVAERMKYGKERDKGDDISGSTKGD